MTVSKPLTEADLTAYQFNSEFLRYLEAFRRERGLQAKELRVLDWGCGRGQATIALERLGYNATGADIDEESVRNGRAFYRDPQLAAQRLRVLDSDGRLDVPDGTFDFVFSETVLEHVADLDTTVRELSRVMATPSASVHVFPPRRGIIEDHLRMPFIHWLPKNRLRKFALFPYVALGIEPRWVIEGVRAKVRRYYDYSVDHTYYRSPAELRRTFERHGFDVEFVAARHPKLTNHPVFGRIARFAPLERVLNLGLTEFYIVELLARKSSYLTA